MSRQTDEAKETIVGYLELAGQKRPGEVAAATGLGKRAVLGLLRSLEAEGRVASEFSERGQVWGLRA